MDQRCCWCVQLLLRRPLPSSAPADISQYSRNHGIRASRGDARLLRFRIGERSIWQPHSRDQRRIFSTDHPRLLHPVALHLAAFHPSPDSVHSPFWRGHAHAPPLLLPRRAVVLVPHLLFIARRIHRFCFDLAHGACHEFPKHQLRHGATFGVPARCTEQVQTAGAQLGRCQPLLGKLHLVRGDQTSGGEGQIAESYDDVMGQSGNEGHVLRMVQYCICASSSSSRCRLPSGESPLLNRQRLHPVVKSIEAKETPLPTAGFSASSLSHLARLPTLSFFFHDSAVSNALRVLLSIMLTELRNAQKIKVAEEEKPPDFTPESSSKSKSNSAALTGIGITYAPNNAASTPTHPPGVQCPAPSSSGSSFKPMSSGCVPNSVSGDVAVLLIASDVMDEDRLLSTSAPSALCTAAEMLGEEAAFVLVGQFRLVGEVVLGALAGAVERADAEIAGKAVGRAGLPFPFLDRGGLVGRRGGELGGPLEGRAAGEEGEEAFLVVEGGAEQVVAGGPVGGAAGFRNAHFAVPTMRVDGDVLQLHGVGNVVHDAALMPGEFAGDESVLVGSEAEGLRNDAGHGEGAELADLNELGVSVHGRGCRAYTDSVCGQAEVDTAQVGGVPKLEAEQHMTVCRFGPGHAIINMRPATGTVK
nr:hypothetical protein CFP56_32311 [Quercus suber]